MNSRKDSSSIDPKNIVNNTHKTPSHYDPHIVPAETAAREAREGDHFGQAKHDDAKDIDHIHTRDGYTSDKEGLFNNYAVEPEMYADQSANNLISNWRRNRLDSTTLGVLLLFAVGLFVLITLMALMPYGSVS